MKIVFCTTPVPMQHLLKILATGLTFQGYESTNAVQIRETRPHQGYENTNAVQIP